MKKIIAAILVLAMILSPACNKVQAADPIPYTQVKTVRMHRGHTFVPEHSSGPLWTKHTFTANSTIIGAELLVCYNVGSENLYPLDALTGATATCGALCLEQDWYSAILECNVGHQYNVDNRTDQHLAYAYGDTHKFVLLMFPPGHGIARQAGESIWLGADGCLWTKAYDWEADNPTIISNGICVDVIVYYVEQ